MANDLVEELLDQDEDYITLTSADGEEIDFEKIAVLQYQGKLYAILQPVELTEGMDEDEALVFSVDFDAMGEGTVNIVLDDAIIDGVFTEYNKMLDEQA